MYMLVFGCNSTLFDKHDMPSNIKLNYEFDPALWWISSEYITNKRFFKVSTPVKYNLSCNISLQYNNNQLIVSFAGWINDIENKCFLLYDLNSGETLAAQANNRRCNILFLNKKEKINDHKINIKEEYLIILSCDVGIPQISINTHTVGCHLLLDYTVINNKICNFKEKCGTIKILSTSNNSELIR